jgi:hypothetical protein
MEPAHRELDAGNVEQLSSALLRRESGGHAMPQTLDFKGIS